MTRTHCGEWNAHIGDSEGRGIGKCSSTRSLTLRLALHLRPLNQFSCRSRSSFQTLLRAYFLPSSTPSIPAHEDKRRMHRNQLKEKIEVCLEDHAVNPEKRSMFKMSFIHIEKPIKDRNDPSCEHILLLFYNDERSPAFNSDTSSRRLSLILLGREIKMFGERTMVSSAIMF